MNLRAFSAVSAACLLSSVSLPAVAQEQALVIGSLGTDGLTQRLEAAGYTVTVVSSSPPADLSAYTQVWDLRYSTAITSADASAYTSYLSNGGGAFLIGEHSGFAARNNSLIDYINSIGGNGLTYGGGNGTSAYVTSAFNGDGAVVADATTDSLYIPAYGTFSAPGNGTYFVTTQADGAGEGVGVAFGTGSLSSVPQGRVLTYLDVNTFTLSSQNQYTSLRTLTDRMISFVAGNFQVDPDLPAVGGSDPDTIDGSQESFDLSSPAASGSTVTFDGGTLVMTNGSGGTTTLAADIVLNSGGGFVSTNGAASGFSGTVSGEGSLNVSGGNVFTLSGTNTFTGGVMVSGGTGLMLTNGSAVGTGGIVLSNGGLGASTDMSLSNSVLLMSGTNEINSGENELTLSGTLEGSGGFIKTGSGTLTLTGTNTYTGGTTVSGGTLVGDTTSLQGDIANGATLQFAQGTDGTYTGTVSGTGALVKTGNGVLTLTGANSYTGGTTVSGGTLVGDTTSLQGDIANGATLQFAQGTDGTYTGTVSGTGALVKTGDGVLTLTGANSYTGGTTVSGGTLVGNTTSLQGDIANNATLQFAQGTDGTYTGTVSGTGALVKTGDGVLTLTGANSYTGGTTVSGGTLIGNTTSLQGDIANNATLQFAQGTDGTYTGTVSGTGALVKTGDGVLTLTGANSYTGGTTVSGGTLIGDTTSLQGDIANNATLQFAQGTDGTYTGTVSGTGALVKTGDGVLTLTGANSYTGGTTVSGGTLVGNTTSLQGDVTNNATLQFAQATDGTYVGMVSGSGALVKTGDGVLTLTGANSYTGGTTVSGGTLAGDTTSLKGNIANNATLQFNQTTNGIFAGGISGTGTLVKTGSGKLNMTGLSAYTGGTIVEQGTLAANGTLASNVDVMADARLMGAGSIGGLIVHTDATLAPGNSIDTLTVDGDALFEVDSIYEVEVNAYRESDLLIVSGTATIEGGTVAVLAADGDYAPRTSYTIIRAGAVDGTFDDITTDLAFLAPSLSYAADSVTVNLTRNDVAFAGVAATANQRAAATAIDAGFDAQSTVYNALVGQNAAGARAAFDSLSGEVHASAMRVAMQDSERFRRSLLNRMDTAEGENQRLWMQGSVGQDDVDGDYNAASFKRATTSIFGGGEFVAGNFLLGLAGGYTDGDLKIADRASMANIDGKHVAAYAAGNAGPIAISAGVTYSDFDVSSSRGITAGALTEQAEADYSARTIEAFGEAGVTVRQGASTITPFVGLSKMWLKRDGFAETGATLGVEGDTQKDSWTAFTAGSRASVPLNASQSVKLNLAARWQRQIDGTNLDTDLAYVAGGPDFAVAGAPLPKNAGLVDAGLSWTVGGLDLALDYSGTWTSVSESHTGKATIGFRF